MSTSIENLRVLAMRDIKDHTAIFDLYVTVGRDIEYIAIKYGMNPPDVINLLEGYGEKITAEDGSLSYAGKGRLKKLPRMFVEEYIEKFYPGIASENPENDWICIEKYLDVAQHEWRNNG
jgi:hypothetical protein